MTIPSCPTCRELSVKHVGGMSGIVIVDYFRCTACGHVWSRHKDDGATTLETLARLEKRPSRAES